MKTMVNRVTVQGKLYDHKLEEKVSGETSKNPGTEFISGEIMISTNEDNTNIVSVHYTYVTAVTGSGKPNRNYNTLKNIVEGKIPTIMSGAEVPTYVKCDTAIGINDFPNRDGEWICAKRNEGGFISIINASDLEEDENKRAVFEEDIVINNVRRIEADESKGLPEKVIIKGAIFDFRGSLLPVEFAVLNPKAMDYFEGLDVSSKTPVFTKVKGIQISQTISRTIEEEGAWGEISVRTVRSSRKEYVVTWAQSEIYEWDTEETILASDLNDAISQREIYLADVKQRNEEYRASRNSGTASAPAKGGYNF